MSLLNPIRLFIRGAQIILIGLLAAFAIKLLNNPPSLSQMSSTGWLVIAKVVVPVLVLLAMSRSRKTDMTAALVTWAVMGLLIWDHEMVLDFLNV